MNNKQLVTILATALCLSPVVATADAFNEYLKKPFRWNATYENIRWIKHEPLTTRDDLQEGYRGQVDIGAVDLEGDKKNEIIKVTWYPGTSNNPMEIDLYKDGVIKQLMAHLEPPADQANFKLEDLDGDGTLEIALWGTVGDPTMSQLLSDESKPFEGHSVPHFFRVAVYKLDKGEYVLQRKYTTKKKYEPFFSWKQKGLPE